MRPLVMHCISTLFPYGGSSRKLLAWVRHSSLAHVFVFYEDDHGSSEESARKLRSGFVAKGARIVRVGRRTLPGQIAAIRAMAKRADGPVALVGHYFRGSALACLSGALCGAPAVLALHGPACLMGPGRKAVHRLFSLQAAIVIYNSEYTARTFASVRCSNCRIVYNGMDPDAVPVKSGPGRGGATRLATIGGLVGWKNHETLIAMMPRLPDAFHLTIIGDGPDRARLESLARRLGVGARVAFLGYVDDAARLLRFFDVLLHPALMESFGMAVLEGLLARIPVVVGDVCATKEVVGHGAYGWIASARDPGAWADAVMRIASDPDGVWERCVAAREWALGRFSGVEYARRMDAAVLCAATSHLQTTAGSRV